MKFTMPRVQDQRKKKKISASCGIFVVLLMLEMLVVVTGGDSFKFLAGESGVRGTSIISSPAVPSRIACAAVCHSESSCLGFNWISKRKICETLFSLREVNSDPLNTIYVPESVNAVNWVKLSYACPSCYGSPPAANTLWEHSCEPNGYAVGVAAASSFNDLDYLLCVNPPGLLVGYAGSQGFTTSDYGRDCTYFPNFLVECVWSNQQNYSSPSQFRHACRVILSPIKVDGKRCTAALELIGHFPNKKDSRYHILQCPPHMGSVSVMMSPGQPGTVDCCLVY